MIHRKPHNLSLGIVSARIACLAVALVGVLWSLTFAAQASAADPAGPLQVVGQRVSADLGAAVQPSAARGTPQEPPAGAPQPATPPSSVVAGVAGAVLTPAGVPASTTPAATGAVVCAVIDRTSGAATHAIATAAVDPRAAARAVNRLASSATGPGSVVSDAASLVASGGDGQSAGGAPARVHGLLRRTLGDAREPGPAPASIVHRLGSNGSTATGERAGDSRAAREALGRTRPRDAAPSPAVSARDASAAAVAAAAGSQPSPSAARRGAPSSWLLADASSEALHSAILGQPR
jgi:hypothetical protein